MQPHKAPLTPAATAFVLVSLQAREELQELQELQQRAGAARAQLVAAAQQQLAAAHAALAQLDGPDMLVADPATLLSYVELNREVRELLAENSSSGSSSSGSCSDADSSSDDEAGSSSGWDNPGDLLSFGNVFFFVADEAGLREAVRQQQQQQTDSGGETEGEEADAAAAKQWEAALREAEQSWSQQLTRVAQLLLQATVHDTVRPIAADVEMSQAARMVYLAEVSW
jgi:exonuclease VII large subunit